MYGKGISKIGGILDCAVTAEIVKKAGAWFSYGDQKLGQGRENTKLFLSEQPEMLSEIEHKVLVHYGLAEGEETEVAEIKEVKKSAKKA